MLLFGQRAAKSPPSTHSPETACPSIRRCLCSLPLITNLIPRKCAITVVVGQPIAVQQEDSPSRETVQAVLDRYIAALEKLYNDNRQRYNVPSDKPPLTIM